MSAFVPSISREPKQIDLLSTVGRDRVDVRTFYFILDLINSGAIKSPEQIAQFISPKFDSRTSELVPPIIYKNKPLKREDLRNFTLSAENYKALSDICVFKTLTDSRIDSFRDSWVCFNVALRLLKEGSISRFELNSLTNPEIEFIITNIPKRLFQQICFESGVRNPIITSEQEVILEQILTDNKKFKNERIEAEKERGLFDLILKLIAKGNISSEDQINQFVNPYFKNDILVPKIRGFFSDPKQGLGIQDIPATISQETADGFIKILRFLKSFTTPSNLKKALIDNYSTISTLR